MKLVVCIDDTDNLESKGTGSIAEEIRGIVEKEFGGNVSYISRHQLLLHEDIDYTSHNSSMAFECEIMDADYDAMRLRALEHLKEESAEGSDPGIGIAVLDENLDLEMIKQYGLKAKTQVLNKDYAYRVADQLGVYLMELGGTGDGVIGALAGIGLRISGNDGEVKGEVKSFKKRSIYSVKELLEHKDVDDVMSLDYRQLSEDELVEIAWKAKLTLVDGKRTILVKKNRGLWESMQKEDLRTIDKVKASLKACEKYAGDVEEEHVDKAERSCLNCRYRRWKAVDFSCVKRDGEDA